MEEEDLIYLTLDNYQECSQLVIKYLSQHKALPYARDLEYNSDQIEIICRTLFLFMDNDTLDTMSNIKSSDPYVFWMHLWVTYGDPNISPFLEDIIPLVVVASSSDDIKPLALVVLIDHVPTTDALDLV